MFSQTLFLNFKNQESRTWIYDVDNHTWTSGPSFSTARRYHSCFPIKVNKVITKIVVMGGYGPPYLSSTEVLDIDSMTWATGPSLPFANYGSGGIESVSGTYLGFSTAGYEQWVNQNGGRYINKIYGLKKEGENRYSWKEVHNMTYARTMHSVVNAPKTLLPNC